MPSSGPRTIATGILRDYLLAALRTAPHPLSTTQLRRHAPRVAMQGSKHPLPPSQETIYRLLWSLRGQGAVTTVNRGTHAHTRVAWIATPNPAADEETAALDQLFAAPSATNSRTPNR